MWSTWMGNETDQSCRFELVYRLGPLRSVSSLYGSNLLLLHVSVLVVNVAYIGCVHIADQSRHIERACQDRYHDTRRSYAWRTPKVTICTCHSGSDYCYCFSSSRECGLHRKPSTNQIASGELAAQSSVKDRCYDWLLHAAQSER